MCKTCLELDKKIDRYRRLLVNITDRRTVAGINELIEKIAAEKAALHPEPRNGE